MLRNEEIKQSALNQRNAEERKYKMMSPGIEVKTTIKSSDGPVRYAFDLDVDYITERIIAMSFPSGGPEAQYRSNLKDVVNMLKTKHQNHYIIFNLSKRRNDIIKMNEQVLDVGWHDSLAPPLERLCSICKQIEIWLKKDSQNVIVLHCKGSRSPIGVVVLAYMNYINITANTETALDRYAMRRFMEAKTDKHVQPSQFRYEEYFTGLLTGAISINSAPLYLHHILIHGVPNYDANGGCRPFLRIYQGMQTVFTSGVYTVPEGTTKFVISLDKALPLRGDILVKCYHKKFRSSTRDVIFRCQFHTTAVVEYRLLFGKEDLDDACTDARFPPFTKVEFIFSSTGDSLHNSDYVSNCNFPVDNGDDPLIRWDSYENFSKLVEGQDSEPESPQPNGGNNNNLSPGPQKYIYASDGSPYAQVQKTPSFSRPQEPLIIPVSQTPVVHQQPPSNPHTNGPTRPNPYSNQNGHTGSPSARPAGSPSGPPVPGNPVERTPSGRKMDFKEQRELEELLRGIEDDKGFQDMTSNNNNQMPGSPQKSPMAESPGNRRIVSVHAELKNAPIPTKKTTPIRPIVEEEFENSPRNFSPGEQSTPPASNSRHDVEGVITPQQTTSVHSAPLPRDQERTPTTMASESVPNSSSNMQTLPNGNVPRDRVPGIPLEHANPTYDYTDKGRGNPNRTVGEVEEPLTEVRLKASPVQLNSLGESKTESMPLSRSPSNVSSNYEPQPLRAQQQKIRFVTQYDDTDHGGSAPSRVVDQSSGSRPKQPDDGFQWLQKQQFKLKEQKDKDGGQSDRYSNPLLVREPGIHQTHQSSVHQRAPSSQQEMFSYPPGIPYQSTGLHSPGSSVKSEPVNNVSSRPYVSDNLSWLEQQQMKLREKRNRERLQMDPSHPLQVDTSYNTSQLPSQPSSISSVRSDVSGFSNNTPYWQRQPESMASRRGHHPEPLMVGGHMTETYQPSLRRGPPTPAYGYDNMGSSPRQGVISPVNGPLESRPYHQDQQTPVRSPSQDQGQTVGTRLFIDEPVSRSKGDVEANANNSANVYRPNKYALDTSLPSKSAGSGSRPVNRSNSLGGYESDSAIQYRPSKGEAESWMQNPGALPSQESEYWNRIEGLRSPGEKSPRDMHSSNESLPNGGTTPKFPVGPKGYANMVRTCIAVVGKPPHGPDDPVPLSHKSQNPAADDEFDVSFPRYPEPARKPATDTRPTPAQEPPLQIRHLEPAQFQINEVPAEERQSYPVQAKMERIPQQAPLLAESHMRTPVSDARVPLQEEPIDVKSLEMLLESVSPTETRGGVPDRPTGPWSHPDVGGRGGGGVVGPQNPSSQHKRQEPEIHYAQVDIEQTRPKQPDRPPAEPVKYAHIQVKPSSYQQMAPTSSSELSQPPSFSHQNHVPSGYQPSYKVPVTGPAKNPVEVEEPISKTHLSPAKVVIEDLPLDRAGQPYRPSPAASQTPPGMPIDAKVVIENRQQVVNSLPTHAKSPAETRPMSPMGNQGQQPTHTGHSALHPSSGGSPNVQHVVPHYMQQPQRAVIEQSNPQPRHEQYGSPQHRQAMPQQHIPPQQYSSPQHASPLQVRPPQQNTPPQQRMLYSQEIRKDTVQQSQQYHPREQQQQHQPSYSPHHQPESPSQQPMYQQQQHRPQQQLLHQPGEPPQHQMLHQQQNQQQPAQHHQHHQHPQLQRLQQQSPGSELPSISFSEATPPPKHVDQQESPIFQQTVGGEESSRSPDLQNLEPTSAPPPMYPTYSDRMKNRTQPLYPTFSDRHRRGHPRLEETFPNVTNGNYKTLYDNRAGSKGRGSSGSDGSAVSPGTTSPVRQAVSPAGPSPIQSGRSTPSNFYLMPYQSPYGSNSSLADPNKEHVRFVKDLSSWWYKPHITREEAIGLLRDKQPGTFVVRDSNSFPGAFGLAIKVAQAPANAPPKKGGDPGNELIRHFLIEPNNRGVRLKGCTNEPIFGSLSALIYQHTLTQLALPCKLVLPDVDPSGGVDSPDAIDPKSAAALLQQGAACSVLFLECVDMESLTGPSAVREAITRVMNLKEKPKGVKVHFKVSLKGVTLTDSARKLFFRKHFPVESILYCGMDPGSRKFPRMEGQDDPDAKCFGFVSRKPGSLTDNQCMVFAEYEMEQPASAIVSFVTKVLLGSKQIKTP